MTNIVQFKGGNKGKITIEELLEGYKETYQKDDMLEETIDNAILITMEDGIPRFIANNLNDFMALVGALEITKNILLQIAASYEINQ